VRVAKLRVGVKMVEQIMVPVSFGELFDKLTILEIKQVHISDLEKKKNVEQELAFIRSVIHQNSLKLDAEIYSSLKDVNSRLWVVEDALRDCERSKTFDAHFIELARSVYVLNDERFRVKSKINQVLGSSIREEKSYAPY
jgi:hypothetical protein